jgi:enamine deaminase RidA (YjgF/YER057c/UK114 family)
MSSLRILFCAALFAFSAPIPAALGQTSKIVVIPPGWEDAYDTYHYAPAVRVGSTVIVSGIPAGRGATYEEQIHNLFENVKSTLLSAGAQMDDVVEITTFHRSVKNTEEFQAEFKKFLSVYDNYFPKGFPAWTAVGTTALLNSNAPVEMRVVAIIGAGKNPQVSRSAPKK